MKIVVFVGKVAFIFLFSLMVLWGRNRAFIRQVYEAYHYDTFNVFHWKKIRITSAEPNRNFVKTQYIVHKPKKFNAFIMGSSRVGNLPPTKLPKVLDDSCLNWYNMSHSVGVPEEHYLTIKTFLKNNVEIKVILLGFDDLMMYSNFSFHTGDLMRFPYQCYENDKLSFFKPYLQTKVDASIINQIDNYLFADHKDQVDAFYDFGWLGEDFSLTEGGDLYEESGRYKPNQFSFIFKDSYKDLERIVDLCKEHGIKLFLFTNPMYQSLFRNSVKEGYFDLLRKVAQKCEFYNFSSLNKYTVNPRYYYEYSHYRQTLGLAVECVIFGTEEERSEIRKIADDDLFGVKVNASNIEEVIAALQAQVASIK